MFNLIHRYTKGFAIAACCFAFQASAGEMTASVEGDDLEPPVARTSDSVQNGDFFITAASRGRGTGDGNDETTVWAFNFRLDREQYGLFRAANPPEVYGAVVELRLSSSNAGQANDRLTIGSLPSIPVESVTGDRVTRVQIDLLDFFDGVTLLEELQKSHGSNLFMRYNDDAIVHGATIRIKYPD